MHICKKLAVGFVLGVGAISTQAYDTVPTWTLTWTNSARNVGLLATDADHGGWTLNVRLDSSRHGGYGLKLGINSGKAFYGSAVASGGGATGELDMRGTITGPGKDGTGTSTNWKISEMPDACFRTDDGAGNANAAYAVKTLRTPGTLLTWSSPYHNDGNPRPVVSAVYVDEPEITGSVPSWFCSGCTNLSVLVLKIPKVITLNSYIAHYRPPTSKTSYDDFDLRSVTTMNGHAAGGCFAGWGAKGTLDVPSLETTTVSNACINGGMGAVLLGLKGNLTSIAEGTFRNCNALTNIVLGASPSGVTLAIGAGAFSGTGVKRVWFNGVTPPALATKSGMYTFGTSATPEGQITFYVPDTPGWADVLAQRDANDMVPASVFNTKNKQYVKTWNGIAYFAGGNVVVDSVLGEVYGDAVKVTGSSEDASGFPYATAARNLYLLPMTMTASTSATPDAQGRSSAFHRWSGVPLSEEQENPLALTINEQPSGVRAFFSHDWTYDTTAQTIANGNWVINVSVVDANKRKLRIGKNSANPTDGTFSTALTGTGSGVLDFTGHVRDTAGNEWTLTHVKSYAMCRARKWTSSDSTATFSDHPTVVVLPETLTSIDGSVFNFNQSQAFPLKEVVLIAPNLTGWLSWTINGPMLLNRMTLRIPKVTGLGGSCIWQNATLSDTDVTDWDFSSVTDIGGFAFASCTGMKGTLKLPSLKTIGHRNFQNHKSLSGVVLATNLTLVSVGSNAFLNATGLRKVTIGNAKAGVTLDQNLFKGATGVADITFLGPRNEALADAVLTGVTATTGAKTATIRASRFFGWDNSVSAATGDEVAAKPSEAAGVYRAGSRKAWLVYEASPFDPRGAVLILR